MTSKRYTQFLRLRGASYRLAFNPHEKVIDIAIDAGFQHAESFSRAFKQVFKVTPSEFRQKPMWLAWHQYMPVLPRKRIKNMLVNIVEFTITPVAMLIHRGQPQQLNETVTCFIEWHESSFLSNIYSGQTYGVAPNDPNTEEPHEFIFQICGSVINPIPEDNAFGVINSVIPGGRCAMLRHQGSHDALTELARSLYADWLPVRGEELRDFPSLFSLSKL